MPRHHGRAQEDPRAPRHAPQRRAGLVSAGGAGPVIYGYRRVYWTEPPLAVNFLRCGALHRPRPGCFGRRSVEKQVRLVIIDRYGAALLALFIDYVSYIYI